MKVKWCHAASTPDFRSLNCSSRCSSPWSRTRCSSARVAGRCGSRSSRAARKIFASCTWCSRSMRTSTTARSQKPRARVVPTRFSPRWCRGTRATGHFSPARRRDTATGHGDGRADFAIVTGLRKDSPQSGPVLLASDAQVNAEPKLRGAKIFADADGTRGGNHGAAGGNLLFTDGHVETIGAVAPRDLSLPPGAKILNPAQ